GLVPRYVADAVVVATLALGAALLGLAAPAPASARVRRPLPAAPTRAAPTPAGPTPAGPRGWPPVGAGILVGALAAFLLSAGWTTARFGDDWAHKQGRDYLRTARAELAAAPRDTVFFDAPVPDEVLGGLSAPYNQQARFFG